MTLYEVIHGVAFAQAFNFYMQQRSLIPPGTLDTDGFNTRIAFAQDLEAAQEYAHTQANLAWAFYQKVTPTPVYGWEESTDTYHGRRASASSNPTPASSTPVAPKESGSRPVIQRPTTPPPPPMGRRTLAPPPPMPRTRDPQSMKKTVRVPSVQMPNVIDPREWMNDDVPPPDVKY